MAQAVWRWEPSGAAGCRESEARPLYIMLQQPSFTKEVAKNGLLMIFLKVVILYFSAALGGVYCHMRESLPDACPQKEKL